MFLYKYDIIWGYKEKGDILMSGDFLNVNLHIGGKTQQVKFEKGVSFENNGGRYKVDNNKLLLFDKSTNNWNEVFEIKMTNYQFSAFKAMANNNNEGENVLSVKDIQIAQQKYKNSQFISDMSEFLPSGYKIEKPEMSVPRKYVQLNVSDGKNSGAKLTFSYSNEKVQAQKPAEAKATKPSGSAEALIGANQEKVEKYRAEFAKMKSADIADKLFKQISGPSLNEKTLSMFDAIPDDKLLETISAYNKHFEKADIWKLFNGETGNPDWSKEKTNYFDSLFYAMNDEYGIGAKEIKPRLNRVFNVLSQTDLTPERRKYIQDAKTLLNSGKDLDKETICKIENKLAEAMGTSPKYYEKSILGFRYWTMNYSSVSRVPNF